MSRVFLHRRRLTCDGVDSAHAIDCTTRTLATEVARTREAGARKPVWPSSLTPVRFARKRLERRPRAPKNARSRHPCRRDAGKLGRYRRRGPGPARRDPRDEPLAPARCFATQSANDRCSSAPEELRGITGPAPPSNLSALGFRVSGWTVRGGHRDGPAGPPPPFMVAAESAPREARLERSPALRWLRREVRA